MGRAADLAEKVNAMGKMMNLFSLLQARGGAPSSSSAAAASPSSATRLGVGMLGGMGKVMNMFGRSPTSPPKKSFFETIAELEEAAETKGEGPTLAERERLAAQAEVAALEGMSEDDSDDTVDIN
jgi:hypothetical protein